MKYKNSTVKKKTILWDVFPWLSSNTAQAMYPNIFVSQKVFDDLSKPKPKDTFIAVLEHENKHIERQKELGFITFGIRYLFSPIFRFQEELLAIREEMRYLKKNKLSFDTDRSAKYLSSWLYLWMTSYDKAKKELDIIWQETE